MDSACHDGAQTRTYSGQSALVLDTPCRIISGPLAANTVEEDAVRSNCTSMSCMEALVLRTGRTAYYCYAVRLRGPQQMNIETLTL